LRSYLLALSFLTVLPIKINYLASDEQMERTLFFYPVVGTTLGIILVAVSWLGHYLQLGIAADTLTVITLVVLTGGLHLDGLMDTADGVMSGKEREKKLEIMKDSRVGAMGVIACVAVLILKITLLSVLPLSLKFRALILAPAAGRWAFVYGITSFPYARLKPGLGSIYSKKKKEIILFITTVILVLTGFVLLKWQGLIIVAATLGFLFLLNRGFMKILGGVTGDTYGATGELAETWVLLVAAVLSRVV
jgi:adenosylcobinamide-GDP ribazoletransferase